MGTVNTSKGERMLRRFSRFHTAPVRDRAGMAGRQVTSCLEGWADGQIVPPSGQSGTPLRAGISAEWRGFAGYPQRPPARSLAVGEKFGPIIKGIALPPRFERHPFYPRQQTSFNSVISSTAKCGPSRPIPLFLTPP